METTKWNNQFLDLMRLEGDPEADNAAKVLWDNRNKSSIIEDIRLISKTYPLTKDKIVEALSTSGPSLTSEDIEKLNHYFEHTSDFSSSLTDFDKTQFVIYENLFKQYGFHIVSLLFFKSLPTGYMCPKPSFVLHNTKLLEEFAARRVMETAQFIFAVSKADWYVPHSRGMDSIQRVRMMHAGMRYALLHNPQSSRKWNMELGIPINQEDLVFTNLLFSVAIIEGLDQMGVHLLRSEREAIIHTWNKIGSALGISEQLSVENYEDALALYNTIYERSVQVDNPYGPGLTHALLAAMNQLTLVNIKMRHLEDLSLYFISDTRSWKSLRLHEPNFIEKILGKFIHWLVTSNWWKRKFDHTRTNKIADFINQIGNYILRKKFNLDAYMKLHPNSPPLVAFTKTILIELTKRDLSSFKTLPPSVQNKKFLIDDKLFEAWGLGGFDFDTTSKKLQQPT